MTVFAGIEYVYWFKLDLIVFVFSTQSNFTICFERSVDTTHSILWESTGSSSAKQQAPTGGYCMRILKKNAFPVAILLNC